MAHWPPGFSSSFWESSIRAVLRCRPWFPRRNTKKRWRPDASEFVLLSLRAILAALQQEEPTVRPHNRIPRKTSPSDQLLAYLRRHPGSKRNDLLNALPELSARMLDRHLQALKDDGSIEYRGSRKTGAYFAH